MTDTAIDPMTWPGYRCARCGGENEQERLRAQLAEAREALGRYMDSRTKLRKALIEIADYDCEAWAVGGNCSGCPACIADKALTGGSE